MNSDQRRSCVFEVLLVVVAVGIYANSNDHPFVFDDLRSIVDNQDIKRLWPPTWAPNDEAHHPPVNSRPLVSLSLALNYAVGGLSVTGYHLFNLGIHLLSSVVLFATLLWLFSWQDRLRPSGIGTGGWQWVQLCCGWCIRFTLKTSTTSFSGASCSSDCFTCLRSVSQSGDFKRARQCGAPSRSAPAPIMVLGVHRLLAAPTLRAALTACLCTESVLGRAPLPQAGNLAESAGVGLRISQHHPYPSRRWARGRSSDGDAVCNPVRAVATLSDWIAWLGFFLISRRLLVLCRSPTR